MINKTTIQYVCCDDISMVENYEEAINSPDLWDLHHKIGLFFDKQWMIDNGFYYSQRAEMLVFIPHDEHSSLHNTGRKPTEEQKQKHSIALRGRKLTEEHKKKIGDAEKGENHYNFGKHRSEETKRKISEKLKGIPNLNLSKKVRQYTKNGEFIAEYTSLADIERMLGFKHSGISRCCNGKIKTAYGYVWRFVD